MRRFLLVLALPVVLVLTTAGTADAAPSRTYTVSQTFGPYNGQANWRNDLPGQPPDGEARVVMCRNARANGDTILSGKATINRRTSHGTAKNVVVTLDVIGSFWNSEVDLQQYGAFVDTNGKVGWNSVTLTITCRRH